MASLSSREHHQAEGAVVSAHGVTRYTSRVITAILIASGSVGTGLVLRAWSVGPDPWSVLSALLWLFSITGSALWLLRREQLVPLGIGVVVVVSALVSYALGAVTTALGTIAVVLSTICLTICFRYLPSVILVALLTLGATITASVVGRSDLAIGIGSYGAALFLATIWIRLEAREWQRQSAIYDQARWAASEFITVNVRMQDTLDRTAGMTRVRERVRVAREIHDTVGYALTAVLMQIQAAREVHRAQPAVLPGRLENLETIVRDTIQEVRREVSHLRDESVVARSGNSRWQRLCDAFADGTGIRVFTELTEDLEQVPAPISECIYRVIQESLTNAYRHGGADYVDVRMAWDKTPGVILARVSDNGKGAKLVQPGNGLSGMRERVDELDGAVEWQTAPGQGFDIGIEIPWDGTIADDTSSAS